MRADAELLLDWQHILAAPASQLVACVKVWLERENPVSLVHPHGFFVVLLGRTTIGEWRFHFWPIGPRSYTGMPAMIHTHDRHVESRILQGQLTNVLYEVTEASPPGGNPLYEVDYGGDRYKAGTSNELRRTLHRVHAVALDSETVGAGQAYRVERHRYHEAKVPEAVATATLVHMHSPSPGPIRVVGLDGYPETISFMRQEHRAHVFVDQLGL